MVQFPLHPQMHVGTREATEAAFLAQKFPGLPAHVVSQAGTRIAELKEQARKTGGEVGDEVAQIHAELREKAQA